MACPPEAVRVRWLRMLVLCSTLIQPLSLAAFVVSPSRSLYFCVCQNLVASVFCSAAALDSRAGAYPGATFAGLSLRSRVWAFPFLSGEDVMMTRAGRFAWRTMPSFKGWHEMSCVQVCAGESLWEGEPFCIACALHEDRPMHVSLCLHIHFAAGMCDAHSHMLTCLGRECQVFCVRQQS